MSNVGHYRITIDYFQYMNEFKLKNQSYQIKWIESFLMSFLIWFLWNISIIDLFDDIDSKLLIQTNLSLCNIKGKIGGLNEMWNGIFINKLNSLHNANIAQARKA